jgi:genome maintenance exonuclease 1
MTTPPLLYLPRYRYTARSGHLFQIQGRPYTGVTTILRATQPAEVRARLAEWQARVGPVAAGRVRREAIERGQHLHTLMEAYLLSRGKTTMTQPQSSWGYWQSLQSVLQDIETTYLVEGLVWHPAGFAGITDALVTYRGQLCVCDWKTSAQPKRWAWLQDEALQVAAYAAAINRVYQPHGVRVNHGLIVIALPDEQAQVFWLEPAQMMNCWQQFQTRLAEFERQQMSG